MSMTGRQLLQWLRPDLYPAPMPADPNPFPLFRLFRKARR